LSSDLNPPTLLIVDGHSLAFRSYYAFARSREGGLRTSTGIPTSVCYGFLKSLLDMIEVEKPTYAAVAFDLAQPTFRHEAADSYKAGRPETPEEFIQDVENLKELLSAFQLPLLMAPGFEADDVIGTLAQKAKAAGYAVRILSGDQDLFQLIDDDEMIKVLHLGSTFAKGNSLVKAFGIDEVHEKLGVYPIQIVDYKALCGDSSDNIPGVKGIGQKTAVQLLGEYGSLDAIYDSLDTLKGAVKTKLETGKADAEKSKYLATIVTDVPIDIDLGACKLEGFAPEAVIPLLKKLEFQNFINRLNKLQTAFGGVVAPNLVAPSQALPELASKTQATGDSAQMGLLETGVSSESVAAASPEGAPPDEIEISPQIITTLAQLQTLVAQLQNHQDPDQPVTWDTETTALDPRDAQLVGIGCCWGAQPDALAYIPVGHLQGEQLPLASVLEALRPILEDAAYPKALQNAKYDRAVLRTQGIHLQGVVFDTMLASYVLNADLSNNLTDLTLRHLNLIAQSYSDLVPKGKTIADIAIDQVAHYCGGDVHTTYRLVSILQAKLKEQPTLDALFREIELPLEPVLAEMEYQGIRVDESYLNTFSKQLEQDIATIEKEAYALAGETFNLGSPKQLSELLFEKLGLDKKKTRKTKTGYSTDAATLEKLQGDHPVIDCILNHRTQSKLKSTYVDALPMLVRPDTHRVHTDFNQAVTATGRLSSSDPNLQNIPIRTAFSRQIRAAFLPEPGWLLVAADYSQIELRILAHLSQEPVLIDAYNTNQDVHLLTAKLLLDKEEISSEERRLGKIINFGIIYGMGATRFSQASGISRTQAKVFIERFNHRYARVFEYLQQIERDVISKGYVETLKGRRRYFNFSGGNLQSLKGVDPASIDLAALKPNGYDAASLRAAANAPIQGSSADIIKIAMIQLHELLKGYKANLLLQVHDELVFEVPPEEWPELEPKILHVMESAVALSVPLKVEARSGDNWMEAK
jgi:DNA polymerase I